MDEKPTRRLAAVWFADIVGYTAVSSTDEIGALELVRMLQEVSRSVIEEHGGRVVKYLGDAVMAEFPSGEGALDAALEVRDGFGRRASESHVQDPSLRVGVHLGEFTASSDGDIYGDVVNTAARLQGEAEPGQVLVSEDVRRQLRRRPIFHFADAGARSLKGKEEPVPTWVAARRFRRPADADADTDAGTAAGTRTDRSEEGRRRLVVLPFGVYDDDPKVDFLAFGLADAVSSSLLGLDSLVIRSPPTLPDDARSDPREVARVAGVDLVLSGTVQRAGDRVRVAARLAEGEDGTVVWNETSTMTMGNLFDLQDALTRRIVESLSEPLSPEERQRMTRDVPASGRAYEMYLRANRVAVAGNGWAEGVELYRAALDEDPDFAPAWARLGRCHRLLAKYGIGEEDPAAHRERAEEAFQRALELNPELSLAHSLYAQAEVESGRPLHGLVRLLRRAARSPSEVHLFQGLTHALRYCGLHEESLAAHGQARALDPDVRTSAAYTHLQRGDAESALEESTPHDAVTIYALESLGRMDEARAHFDSLPDATLDVIEPFARTVFAAAEGDRDAALRHGRRATEAFPDPEGRYFMARSWARAGAEDEALDVLRSAVEDGFYCVQGLRTDPMFSSLRDAPAFGAVVERADAGRAAALEAFRQERLG